jgi:hypothetical protein
MSDTLFAAVEGTGKELARAPSTMDIIAQVSAMPSDAGDRVALMEKLIAMKYADEDREAKKRFEEAFGRMQKALPAVKKNKLNGGTNSYYAELEELQRVWDPVLFEYGFTYSWREELAVEGQVKRTWFDLSQFGHTKSNFFDAPKIEPNRSQNLIHVSGVQSSYGYRYSYRAGVGGRVEGEDPDGTLELDEELKKTLADIEAAANVEDLLAANKRAMAKYSNTPNAITFILGTYAQARKRLTGGPQ